MSQVHLPIVRVVRPRSFPTQVQPTVVELPEENPLPWSLARFPTLVTILFIACVMGVVISAIPGNLGAATGFIIGMLLLIRWAP